MAAISDGCTKKMLRYGRRGMATIQRLRARGARCFIKEANLTGKGEKGESTEKGRWEGHSLLRWLTSPFSPSLF